MSETIIQVDLAEQEFEREQTAEGSKGIARAETEFRHGYKPHSRRKSINLPPYSEGEKPSTYIKRCLKEVLDERNIDCLLRGTDHFLISPLSAYWDLPFSKKMASCYSKGYLLIIPTESHFEKAGFTEGLGFLDLMKRINEHSLEFLGDKLSLFRQFDVPYDEKEQLEKLREVTPEKGEEFVKGFSAIPLRRDIYPASEDKDQAIDMLYEKITHDPEPITSY
jgi:hypothetical protein